MSSKPETQFIQTVHKHLRATGRPPHFEKNWNAYRSGTPDVFYSGDKGVLWVEYKLIPRLPVRSYPKADLTPLQNEWLRRRHDEGREVAVVLGVRSERGGIILRDRDWELPVRGAAALITPYSMLASWILTMVGPASDI